MDLFVLDSLLRRTAVIDTYESLIWTERFAAAGDFELVIHSTLESRSLLTPGTQLAINESTRCMTVETVDDKNDSTGRALLTIKGPSFEDVLNDRAAKFSMANTTDEPNWIINAQPADAARQVFYRCCIQGALSPNDVLPFYTLGSIYPLGTIPEPSAFIPNEIKIGTVYEAIKEICDIYELGFRITRNGDTSQLMFNIYAGNDRTTLQSTLTPVVFAPELDNLADVSYLTSTSAYKNVAYVVSPAGTKIVYANGMDATVTGFARKVLYVAATDIVYPPRTYTVTDEQQAAVNVALGFVTTLENQKTSLNKLNQKTRLTNNDILVINQVIAQPELSSGQKTDITAAINISQAANGGEDAAVAILLEQRGKEELAKNSNLAAFDGEIPQFAAYKYHRDYELGDLVEIRNADGITQNMRITEQIFVSDIQGERSYPTLAVKLLITPGSWYAWNSSQVWDDALGYWVDA